MAPVDTAVAVSALDMEGEPDDDYRPVIGKESAPLVDPGAATPSAAEGTEEVPAEAPEPRPFAEDDAEEHDAEEAETPCLPTLVGHWQQLEGVARTPVAGPRFLAWNGLGHVAVYPEEARLEVHYAGEAEPQRHVDSIGLNMAALSPSACCLAAGAGAGGGSQLVIRPRERWDKAVLTATLGSADENVEAIACGDTFVAALTSKRFLRIYGHSGLPLGVVSCAGSSVTLAARGEFLLAVTRIGGAPLRDDQDDTLDFRLLDVRSRSQRAAGRLPLGPGARLRWVGLSAELAPVVVDTLGVVRALLGTGPGSWGPAGGGGGEWTVVAQLAKEEEAVGGPLWVVDVCGGMVLCAEVGAERLEPQPRASTVGVFGEAPSALPLWGHGGAELRQVRWEVPLGPVVACGSAAEEAFRETLFAKHVEELKAMDALGKDALAKATAVAGGWRAKVFQLYGKLVQAEQHERALDVARHLLSPAGGSTMLNLAQSFAEKAGCHKLADQIALLPRLAPVEQFAQAAPRAQACAVPKVIQRELPPLFVPGDAEEEGAERMPSTPSLAARVSSALIVTPPISQHTRVGAPEQEPSQMSCAAAPTDVAGGPLEASVPAAEFPVPPAALDAAAAPVASSAAAAAPAASSNPFARRQKSQVGASRTPHLLRDALGGVAGGVSPVGDAAAVRRPGVGAAALGEEPAAKVARVLFDGGMGRRLDRGARASAATHTAGV
eukprot:CAMPEP_0176087932 /NCGR_PEP_ID=MMETSP0120_2-20121206/44025_1 /TAXON_ID=160619 /ORGANISM="Kryptoperidinium foliaceum, Strain CCMP 1326" /LENGTH=720 /DNA_ID=CAMNT_0017421783 /DNA_START=7 /DNA_END=2166 /DNA_ORIENTATION=-